jgi:CRP/FNR family cyclic AMP-dependent transcriptional regulator
MRLLDLEPDLLQFVSGEDRTPLEPVRLAVIPMPEGQPLGLTDFLESRGAIGAVVQTGMLLHDLQLGTQPGVRVLGPGEVLSLREAPASPLLAASTYRATSDTTLVLLRDDFLLAARRAPGLMIGVQARLAEQIERLATQLVICQVPRVEDRLLAMLWLLAESWGRVTPSGTTLPLSLTHELLGAMIGARRPTVTLALGELAERGALVHQDRGWLLLERPELASGPLTPLDAPRQLRYTGSSWGEPAPAENGADVRLDALRETIRGLRDQHLRNVRRIDDRLRRSALSQQRARELRESIRRRRGLSRRLPPSS